MTQRSSGTKDFFLEEFCKYTDRQTEAFVTSNGMNRYAAYRIDMQAFYIGTIFAGICLFTAFPKTPAELAVKAIGFQMAVEVARHFNSAIRWSFVLEVDLVAVKRLLTYANLEPEQSLAKALKSEAALVKGNIEFKNVEMKYQEHLQPAIKDLTFKICAGEKIAVVGRTGAGKSSFFQLLQGFRENCAGEILLDGINIKTLSKQELRKNIAVVLQNPYINPNESVKDKLLGTEEEGEQSFSDRELKFILEEASLSDIDLDTEASKLSGGQVQLLSIAEVMLNQNNASMLLLDEPTSHIDPKSQTQVLDSLFKRCSKSGQTVLMVAHRLETAVTYCDKILVLDQGQLVEFNHTLDLLVADKNDTEITSQSLFAEMVKALQVNQQSKILEIAKGKLNN